MARSYVAPRFGRRRSARWIAAALVASLAVVSFCFRPAGDRGPRIWGRAFDPNAVPDGAEKLVEYINKMRHSQPPKNTQGAAEKHAFLVRTHTQMLQAADKLLAADPSPGQRAVAFKAKYEAVMLLREPTGEEPPNDQQLTELVKQLKSETDPEMVKLFKQGTFTLKLSALARADQDTLKVWEEIKAELKANPPDRAKLAEVEEGARRIERFQTSQGNLELLSKVYLELLAIALDHPQPASADVVKRIALVAKRLTLVGKPIEIKGRTVGAKPFDWSTMSGKVVLVEFWAASVPLSVNEVPLIKQALEKYHDKGFEVVGISLDDDKKVLTQCIADQKINWVNLFGESKGSRGLNHPMALYYGVNGSPTGILVNRNGLVVSIVARGQNLDRLLTQLMTKQPAPANKPPASQPGAASEWKPFSSKERQFAVSFPTKPQAADKDVDSAVGKMKMHLFVSADGDSVYMVMCGDPPAGVNSDALKNFNTDSAFDGAAAGIVSSTHTQLIKSTKISLGKWPGRELLIGPTDEAPLEYTWRIYYVGARQYQVVAGGPKGKKPADADMQKFFDSFKITADAAANTQGSIAQHSLKTKGRSPVITGLPASKVRRRLGSRSLPRKLTIYDFVSRRAESER